MSSATKVSRIYNCFGLNLAGTHHSSSKVLLIPPTDVFGVRRISDIRLVLASFDYNLVLVVYVKHAGLSVPDIRWSDEYHLEQGLCGQFVVGHAVVSNLDLSQVIVSNSFDINAADAVYLIVSSTATRTASPVILSLSYSIQFV
jgi:hypothetical protein